RTNDLRSLTHAGARARARVTDLPTPTWAPLSTTCETNDLRSLTHAGARARARVTDLPTPTWAPLSTISNERPSRAHPLGRHRPRARPRHHDATMRGAPGHDAGAIMRWHGVCSEEAQRRGEAMARCDTCGNEYEHSFEVTLDGR